MSILRKAAAPASTVDAEGTGAARPEGAAGPHRIVGAVVLFLFAPVSAEYLIGYDVIAGDPAAMVFGLVVFAPLYGASALLIREIVRRAGRGWPSILLLGAGFGLVQAGLIDQGLFNPDYRGIPYWAAMREPTMLGGLGVSGFQLFHFTALHAFGSVFAPVVVAEAISGPVRTRPWLRLPGLVVVAAIWLAAAVYVGVDHAGTEGRQAAPAQVIGVLLAVGLLAWLALRRPRRPDGPSHGVAPAPLTIAVASLALLAARPLLAALSPAGPEWNAWAPTVISAAMVVGWAWLMARWSQRPGWTGRHELAAAAGYLLAVGGAAFVVEPLGSVYPAAKYLSNVGLLVVVAILVAVGRYVQSRVAKRQYR